MLRLEAVGQVRLEAVLRDRRNRKSEESHIRRRAAEPLSVSARRPCQSWLPVLDICLNSNIRLKCNLYCRMLLVG